MIKILIISFVIILVAYLMFKLGGLLYKIFSNYHKKQELKDKQKDLDIDIEFKEYEIRLLKENTNDYRRISELKKEVENLKQQRKNIK